MLVQEVIDKILDVLDDSSVTNSGLVRQWTEDEPPVVETVSRTVTVTAEPEQDQPVPYVRVTATDSAVLDGEPFGYDYQPDSRVINLTINVFSDWETEARSIAAAIEALLVHRQIETDDFRGWTWMDQAARFYTDNTSDPNEVYRIAALVFRAIVQAKTVEEEEEEVSNLEVDLWQAFDFDTLSEENLGSGWTISDSSGHLSASASGEKVATGTINDQTDEGTHGLVYQSDAQYEGGTVRYALSPWKDSISVGFWFKFPAAFVGSFSGGEPDLLRITNAVGQYQPYVKLIDNNAATLRLFTSEANVSDPVNVSPDTWYWITVLYQASGTHRMRVYNATGELIGQEQTRTSEAGFGASELQLGNLVGDPSAMDAPIYYDDFVADWTDATFPLGPP